MKVVFFGTPDFAVSSLRALYDAHTIVGVVTQPDRPKGRGRMLAPPPVKIAANELGLPVFQPERVRGRRVREQLAELGGEVFVVAAFGQILRPRLLDTPQWGCLNVHASLLPRYRGAAPIQWAIINGDSHSGVTIMQMDAGVDTGPILLQERMALASDETAGSLHDKLAPLGARLIVKVLSQIEAASPLNARPQDGAMAVEAPMLEKTDSHIDFSHDAGTVDQWIRGLDPWPGAWALVEGQTIKLFCSEVFADARGEPGALLAKDDRGMLIACNGGGVWVKEAQLANRRRMPVKAMLTGNQLPEYAVFC